MIKLTKRHCTNSPSVYRGSTAKPGGSCLMLPILAAALTFTACDQDHAPIVPDTPDTPTAEYHLRFSGSVGDDNAATRANWTDNNDGKLTFAWDYQESDATTSDLKMAFIHDNGHWLLNDKLSEVTQARILRHTDPAKADDKHWAEFETIDGFDPQWTDDNFDGYNVYAVIPINDVNNSQMEVKIKDNKAEINAVLKMPTTFTQSGENNLAHLSDYIYMYATDVLVGRTVSLDFAHLASYIRFKVYNWRGEPATLYGVKLEVVDAGGNAVPASGSQASYTSEGFVYTPATDGNGIQVDLADNGLTVEDNVSLYASVFPVGSENPFQNNTLRFTLIAQEPTGTAAQGEYTYPTYELSAETFYKATKSYDWQVGDLYTFHLYLDDVLTIGKVTVNDWTDGGTLDAGVADESYNEYGIKVSDGSYEPATLNADGNYEISNMGNLLWYAANKGGNNALLTSDIKIGSAEEPYVNWSPIKFDEAGLVFDGDGHTIEIYLTYDNIGGESTGNLVSLFNANNTTIRNLELRGSIHCNSSFRVGAVSGGGYAVDFENIISYVDILNEGTAPTGGITGYFGFDGARSAMSNCAVYADVSGQGMVGGLVGQGWAGYQYYTIRNSAFYGSVSGAEGKTGAVVGYSSTGKNSHISITHTYYYTPTDIPSIGGWNAAPGTNDAKFKTAEEFASEDMADLLNAGQETDVWRYFNPDPYPTFR